MHVITQRRLKDFWEDPKHPNSEEPLRSWLSVTRKAQWPNFAAVRNTYPSADQVGSKTVFDIGGNKIRLITVIDFQCGKVFIRHVLTHKDYDRGQWKSDEFGDDWKKAEAERAAKQAGQRSKKKRKGT